MTTFTVQVINMLKRHYLTLIPVLIGLLLLVLAQTFSPSSEREGWGRHSDMPPPDQDELDTVKDNVRACFNRSNIAAESSDLFKLAVQNAQLFLVEYRRVIPKQSYENHSSHCWPMSYTAATTSWFSSRVIGHINDIPFDSHLDILKWYSLSQFVDLSFHFSGHFSSNTLCLPKTYLLGFEKCGSTYLWCFISKILSAYREGVKADSDQYHAGKEPYFWTPFTYTKSLPNASTIGQPYMLHFLRSVAPEVSREERRKIMLIDGTPGTVIEWPNFREDDPTLANYCLLPSTLPQLFPDSKYLVIMRDPVKMLYSNFWWSYQFLDLKFPYDIVTFMSGPKIFHENSVAKILTFLDCLKDESQSPCPFFDASDEQFSECVLSRKRLHSKCVQEITNERERKESALHRAIYYVHVQKWLSVLPRERILFVTLERLSKEPSKIAAQLLDFFEVDGERNKVPLTDETVNKLTENCSKNSKGIIDYKWWSSTRKPLPDTEPMLRKFLAPFNKLLAELLDNKQFLWK